MSKLSILTLNLIFVILFLNANCSFPSPVIPAESKVQEIDPSVSQMYLNQLSCPDSIAKCHSSCLEKYPYQRFTPRNSTKRVLCEDECYQTLRKENSCVFYQSTSFR